MDDSETSSASSKSESGVKTPFSTAESIKSEKLETTFTNLLPSTSSSTYRKSESYQFSKGERGEKPRTKRPYNKKQKLQEFSGGFIEKPPPKKRGRKSKKELLMMGKKSEFAQQLQPVYKKAPKIKSPSHQKSQKIPKKTSGTKNKKSSGSGSSVAPSVFDKKMLAGPHLTMKQVLEYILTDHSYCVPPDPLPAVGSNHQMIRYILGPKNGAKARSLPTVGVIETGSRSPITYTTLPRNRAQFSSTSIPSPPSSKLEHLLKRGESALSLGGNTSRFSNSKVVVECRDESDVELDVESVDPEPEKRVAYDVQKAREVMNECEKYVEFARDVDTGDSWESKIVKTGWTKCQSTLFDKVIGTLHAERLSRLTYAAAKDTEPVLRRASLDKTACRIRRIFGECLWDTKLTQWLHSILTEFLNFAYLAIYMDVLQTLKAQCPQLINRMMKLSIITPLQSAYGRNKELFHLLTPFLDVDKSNEVTDDFEMDDMKLDSENDQMMFSNTNENISPPEIVETKSEIHLPARSVVPRVEEAMLQLHSAKNAEAFRTLLERQWDPFSPDLLQRLKKLSANPIFLMIAPGAIFPKLSLNRRLKQYYRMFNRVGKIIRVGYPSGRDSLETISPAAYLERMISHAREKIKQVRHLFPDRPLFLVGWGSGSILAARLSVTAGPVDGIVALGFPLHSLREMYDDVLKIFGGIKHPLLFVIGGLASNNSLTDMELFRRRLACETSLVVVGSGNENLYVARDHREKLLITQTYVDKTVMDEVAYFVNLHSKHNQIIAAHVSMKPSQFSKSQSNSDMSDSRKSSGMNRSKKRKSSFNDTDNETFAPSNNEDSKDSFDNEFDNRTEAGSGFSNFQSGKRDDSSKPSSSGFDYGFDGPKFIPSNKSSSKRKAYYRPDPTSVSSSTASSPSCITASKLLQQSPNVKRRMSKPSGPTHRVPLINKQTSQHSNSTQGQVTDIPKDDHASLYNFLSSGNAQAEKTQSNMPSALPPFPLRQNEGSFPGVSTTNPSGAPYANNDAISDKIKKKSSSKSKSARLSKTNSTESSSSSIVCATNEAPPTQISNLTNLPPQSALDIHKFLLQHQQHQQLMAKQYEQCRQERPQSSQLFKLLSPGAESPDNASSLAMLPPVSGIPGSTADLVKLKLIGSQTVSPDVMAEARTAMLSKQSIVSNMALPMIRLSRPDDTSQQKPLFVTGSSIPGNPILGSVPSGDSSEKILFRTNDNSIMKLSPADLKNLIGSRGIQLVTTGLPSQNPVNIMVNRPQESAPTLSSVIPNPSNESSGTSHQPPPLPSTDPAATSSLVIPTLDAPKLFGVTQSTIPPQVQRRKTKLGTSSVSEQSRIENSSLVQQQGEPMDIETDEEMSGLLISSTFSVCPTSGERVPPNTVAAASSDALVKVPTAEKTLDPFSTEEMLSTNELLIVPIHVQAPNDTLTEGNIATAVATAARTVLPTTDIDNKTKELDDISAAKQDGTSAPTTATAATSIVSTTDTHENSSKDLNQGENSTAVLSTIAAVLSTTVTSNITKDVGETLVPVTPTAVLPTTEPDKITTDLKQGVITPDASNVLPTTITDNISTDVKQIESPAVVTPTAVLPTTGTDNISTDRKQGVISHDAPVLPTTITDNISTDVKQIENPAPVTPTAVLPTTGIDEITTDVKQGETPDPAESTVLTTAEHDNMTTDLKQGEACTSAAPTTILPTTETDTTDLKQDESSEQTASTTVLDVKTQNPGTISSDTSTPSTNLASTTTDEEKRKSKKGNPVRRSARLKSGV